MSKEGKEFSIAREVAKLSGTIKKLLDISQEQAPIPLLGVNSSGLKHIIGYLKFLYAHRSETKEIRITKLTKVIKRENYPFMLLHALLDASNYLQIDEPVRKKMDLVLPEIKADKVHLGVDLPQAYSGEGVVIGILDGGFDYTNPNFLDITKTQSRISRVWEQNYTNGTPPAN